MHEHSFCKMLSLLLYCISVERQIQCLYKYLHISTLEVFLFEDTDEEVCQKMDMPEICQKLSKQSMPYVYLVILEYEEKQDAKSIGSHTIIDGGWARNT